MLSTYVRMTVVSFSDGRSGLPLGSLPLCLTTYHLLLTSLWHYYRISSKNSATFWFRLTKIIRNNIVKYRRPKLLCRIIRSAHVFVIAMATSSSLAVDSVVCGYHVYLAVWEPCVEERSTRKWKPPRQSRDGRLPQWGSWCWFRIATRLASTSLPTASTSLQLLPLACSLLPLACLEVISVQRLGLSTGRDAWMTRYVNRLVLPKTGREMLWFCSRRQVSEVVGQPTSLRASSSIHLCRREMYTCKHEVPKMRLN